MKEDMYWYWLVNLGKGIGPMTQKRMLDYFDGDIEKLYYSNAYVMRGILKEAQQRTVEYSHNEEYLKNSYQKLLQSGTRFISWDSPEYPDQLREISSHPFGFYLRGSMPDPDYPILAIVGSRTCTQYGWDIAERFSREMAKCHISVIGGLAAGIDTAGHTGALREGGYSLGILGGGIDTVYPQENFNLYLKMYEEGGVMSEYNIGTKASAQRFPQRNRLISGISDGVLIVEARKKSGSLITADLALSQDRPVMAVPGRITDSLSTGTLDLIYDGASMVRNVQDVLDLLLDRYYVRTGNMGNLGQVESQDRMNTVPVMEEDERIIYELLDYVKPLSFDQIEKECRLRGIDIRSLPHNLFSLELKGIIGQQRQNMYVKVL
ncbi:MAG: DNA-processing protein DprA [Lachnospiraceae bacterium]|nr:DNA-processing protein DprA [Lachnospiraceae bacterium]